MRLNPGILLALLLFGCNAEETVLSVEDYTCNNIPRPENTKLALHDSSDDWFQVYESAPGVYSIVEPFQIQETISHLIVGDETRIAVRLRHRRTADSTCR